MKKVLIVGCGAIGSLFAAHLAKGGEVEVYAFDVSRAHIDAINQKGLRLSGASDLHVRLAKASTDPVRASGLRIRHRRDQGNPHRRGDRGCGSLLRRQQRGLLGTEWRGQ